MFSHLLILNTSLFIGSVKLRRMFLTNITTLMIYSFIHIIRVKALRH